MSFRRSAQLRRYRTVADALDALSKDEVDAVFGDKAQLWLWSQTPEGICCAIVGDDVKHRQTLGVGVAAGLRKEDAKLREALNNALGEIMSDGTYTELNRTYFPFPLIERSLQEPVRRRDRAPTITIASIEPWPDLHGRINGRPPVTGDWITVVAAALRRAPRSAQLPTPQQTFCYPAPKPVTLQSDPPPAVLKGLQHLAVDQLGHDTAVDRGPAAHIGSFDLYDVIGRAAGKRPMNPARIILEIDHLKPSALVTQNPKGIASIQYPIWRVLGSRSRTQVHFVSGHADHLLRMRMPPG